MKKYKIIFLRGNHTKSPMTHGNPITKKGKQRVTPSNQSADTTKTKSHKDHTACYAPKPKKSFLK